MIEARRGGWRWGAGLALLSSCSTPLETDTAARPGPEPNTATAHESTESLDADFDAAAAEFDIPAVLLKAIAWEHTRWQMVDGQEEFEGKAPLVGLMGVPGDRVETAAVLLDVHPDLVRYGRLTNVRAYAALLDASATGDFDRGDLALWAQAVAFVAASSWRRGRPTTSGAFGSSGGRADRLAVIERWMWCPPPRARRRPGPDRGGVAKPPPTPRRARREAPASRDDHPHCEGSYSGCWSWPPTPVPG